MKPEKQVTDAVEKAQRLLAEYVATGKRDCERTVGALLDVLNDEALKEAVDDVKEGRTATERREGPPDPKPKIEVLDESGAVRKTG